MALLNILATSLRQIETNWDSDAEKLDTTSPNFIVLESGEEKMVTIFFHSW